jgi:hypothetical protein
MPKLPSIAAAIVLLVASALTAAAQSSKPGSVDPAPAPAAPAAAPAPAPAAAPPATTETTTEPEKKADAGEVKKPKRRHARHRYVRDRHWRQGLFFIPPPQYWFRPWPRYRHDGWRQRHYGWRHRHYHRRHYYAGFPFFGFRW